ncbi:unnamed protein product [Alopecurus aequalis]
MTSRRRTWPTAGPLEDDDLLAEILLRLPPKPSSLPRASLVCKRWRSIATAAAFRRRFRTHHRRPPILGVFEEHARGVKFLPLLGPPDRIPSERFSLDLSADNISNCSVLGCRHGRVLFLNPWANALLVFEPVSGDTHRIIIPQEFVLDGSTDANAAVFCAAGDDHVHGDCHTSPFKVVVVGTGRHAEVAIARVYSQETGMWGDLISSAEPFAGGVTFHPSTLSGNALYWCLCGPRDTAEDGILKFDLDNQSLTVISRPPAAPEYSQIQIIRAEHGGLGLAILSYRSFQLWDYIVDCHGVATWVMRKTVNMDEMLGSKARYARIVGYAEHADAIFLSAYEALDSGLLMYYLDPSRHVLVIVHLESMNVEKHRGSFHKKDYHPFTNFYTAGTARA